MPHVALLHPMLVGGKTITKQRFIELERTGDIMYRGELPQFVDRVRWVVENSDVLSDEDIDIALAALR